jgi:DNA-binding SARP family transcriptional activator
MIPCGACHSDDILTPSPTLQEHYKGQMIVLRALGTAEIDTGVSRLTPSQEIVFAAALYLILERGKRVSRTQLAAMLWPAVAERARAHRLRQTIFQLKKLGIIVMADRDTLRLSQHEVRSDVDDLAASDASSALTRDSLEFLPGYTPRLSEPLRDWVEGKRASAHATATAILIHEVERSRLQADWSTVEKASAKCLSLDSYNETAVLAQAEAAAMRGGKRKAVSILDRYIAEMGIGAGQGDLQLPAALLRRRVVERIPDRPPLLNIDPPFVGREAEMEILTRKFNEAREGHGSAILLVGEPGIGKSRLSAELARFAELQGALVQRATCRRADVDRPLSLFVDTVPQLREMPGALGCAPESFAFLKRLTEFDERPQEAMHQGDSDTLFQNLRAALFDLVDSIVEERSLLVVIEDVQWLDDASAKILIGMVQRSASQPIFFLFNLRPSHNALLDYAEKSRWETAVLGPLKPAPSMALLNSVALRPGDRPEADFASWCLEVAEGNPFFLQELAHQWIETGRRHEAPPSIAKVLQERLSRLSPEALRTLQVSSILGEHATLDRVEAVLEYQPHQILAAIDELSTSAMLKSNEPEKGERPPLQPRHDFLASAAIGRLPAISVAFIHRRSAEVLDQEIAQNVMPTNLLWACATHRHHAGDRDKARTLSLSCAEQLLAVGLAHDSCKAFEKCLDYCTSDDQKLEVLPRLASALQLIGEWDRTKAVLRACISIAEKLDPGASTHNEFELRLLAARHQSALDFPSLFADLLQCVKSSAASPSHRVRAAVIALKISTDIGPPDALDSIYSEVEHLLKMPDVPERARLEVEMIVRTTRQREVVSEEELRKFVAVARASTGDLSYSNALLTAAAACRISGRYEVGLEFVMEAFDHEKQLKHYARLPFILISEIRLHVAATNYPMAEASLARLMEYPIPPDDEFMASELETYKVRLAVERGSAEEASAGLKAMRHSPESYSPRRRANCLALTLRVRLLEKAELDEIRQLVSRLEVEHLRVRDLGGHDFEAYSLCLGFCALGKRQRGIKLLYDYLEHHRLCRWPIPGEIVLACRGDGRVASKPILSRDHRNSVNQRGTEVSLR